MVMGGDCDKEPAKYGRALQGTWDLARSSSSMIIHYSHVIAKPRQHYSLQAPTEHADETDIPVTRIFPRSHEFHVPLFIALISIFQMAVFMYQGVQLELTSDLSIEAAGPTPHCSWLIYNPYRRYEVWRLITYMMVHSGYVHLITNIIVQLVLGFPLEIVHGSLRVTAVYLTGVLSGSLITSITDPLSYLLGASGGSYALLLAHLPTLIMNWREMKSFIEWIVSVLFVSMGLVNLGISIYQRYSNDGFPDRSMAFSAHMGGAAAGFLVGMNILRNFRQQPWEGHLRLACCLIWVLGVLVGILWNSFGGSWFPESDWTSVSSCSPSAGL